MTYVVFFRLQSKQEKKKPDHFYKSFSRLRTTKQNQLDPVLLHVLFTLKLNLYICHDNSQKL